MKVRFFLVLVLGGQLFAGAGSLRGETFTIEPVHSAVLYRAGHMGVSRSWGRFNELSGTISFDEANPSGNAIDITIKASSIDSGAAKRDEHLRSPDFLNAKQFPEITFKSEKVQPVDAKTYEVTGTLTLHGISRPLTFKLERTGGGKSPFGGSLVGLESTFQIKRSDFDMKKMLDVVADEVQLTVSVEAGHR